jgi:hypothetical protein
MNNIQLCISDQFLLLAKGSEKPVQVMRVDTVSRSYLIGRDHGGEAARAGTPMLDVISVCVDGREDGDRIRLRGFVSGHPLIGGDGKIMNTSLVTAFHLKNGDVVQTSYGLRKQSRNVAPKTIGIKDVVAHTPA